MDAPPKGVAPQVGVGKRGARLHPRTGDERLSESKKGDSSDAANRKGASDDRPAGGKNRKQRSGDVGRALRSVYDDTLRETVPDDFMDLLGRLS